MPPRFTSILRLLAGCSVVGALALIPVPALAQEDLEATTDDGRRVRLRADSTWEFIERDEPGEQPLELSISRRYVERRSCVVWLRLVNNSGYLVKNIVPHFSAYLSGNVLYDKVFTDFQWIKPTKQRQKAIRFERIDCDQIEYIKVGGADRCEMGELEKFSSTGEECLGRVKVLPSDLIDIRK